MFILEGAKQNQLPQNYVEKIESFEFKIDKNKERRKRRLKILNEEV